MVARDADADLRTTSDKLQLQSKLQLPSELQSNFIDTVTITVSQRLQRDITPEVSVIPRLVRSGVERLRRGLDVP